MNIRLILFVFSLFCANFSAHAEIYNEQKLKEIIVTAENGDVNAQFRLGNMFNYGTGVKQDRVQAAQWYRKAAVQGYSPAKYILGTMYTNGEGVKRDKTQADMWFRKAAEIPGDSTSNINKSIDIYRTAALKGAAYAQFNLGQMYEFGKGVEQDKSKAVKWYLKAAKQGDPSAQNSLGICFDNGIGVKQDKQMALKWLRKAADQEHPAALYNLGIKYYKGEIVEQDGLKAIELLRTASAQGHSPATRILPALVKSLIQ